MARARSRTIGLALALTTLLGLGLRLYQLSRPGYLFGVTEYDDGADFGSALRLVHGVLPYRDFITVQPPGITLLMTPAALLSYGVGTAKALAVGRVLTACAGAACVLSGGLLVRHRGPLAVAVVGGILAVHPDGVAAAHTVLLEPWLVLCCLLGALAVFDGDRIVDGVAGPICRSRFVWGGVAFGFAGTIKVWAILPVIVIAALCVRTPRRLARFVGAVAVGFGVPTLPFLLLAPRTFVDSVVVAQLTRVDATRVAPLPRLASMVGLTDFTGLGTGPVTAVALGVVVLAIGGGVVASLITRRPPQALETFALATAGLVVVAFLSPDDYYYHYAGFFVPFLALAVGLPVTRLAATVPMPMPVRHRGLARPVVAGVAVVAILGAALVQTRTESGLADGNPAVAAAAAIPPGACVLTDMVSLTIAADRFFSTAPGCSPMVDGVGTDYSLSHGRNGENGAGSVPQVESVWLAAFQHAGYVWLSSSLAGRRIPWTPTITAYFDSHFRPLPVRGLSGLYVRDSAQS